MGNSETVQIIRLDQKVQSLLPELSRTSASKLIEQGKVSVNGQVQQKASFRLKSSDQVALDYKPGRLKIPKIDLSIIYEDDDCLVIDKLAGLLTHSKGAFNPEATVATWLSTKLKGMSGERAGIVHRLDRQTSGVMIAAKNPRALSWLQKQFSTRKVKKTYLAIVQGDLKEEAAVIDMPIERHPKKPQTFRAGLNGKPAKTQYRVLKSSRGFSLLELMPETGRTHQLRVHLSQIGHPILGDEIYGGKKAERMYLHAMKLELTLPNKNHKVFVSQPPKEFAII